MKKTNNNITELVFILDRSGSMGGLESDTIGGFNALLNKQKKQDGVAYVSTILFDHESFVLHDRLPIDKVEPLTDKDYTVRGCTALLDALGDAIHHIGNIHKYARPEDVPAQTMFVIITDGMENASRRYDGKSFSSARTSTPSPRQRATALRHRTRWTTTPTAKAPPLSTRLYATR